LFLQQDGNNPTLIYSIAMCYTFKLHLVYNYQLIFLNFLAQQVDNKMQSQVCVAVSAIFGSI
jgi:hypothetical protein